MIIAGMDAVAITVEWAMAELIRKPGVQQKAQEELDNVIGQERTRTEEDLQSLPYLQAIVKKALRLHPPTPLMLPHRANTDPKIWLDPNEFRPEWLLEEDIDIKGHGFRLLPFGAGRRVCSGAQLGLNFVTLMLGRLLHHFNWIPFKNVKYKEIDISEGPGIVTYMVTPLQVVPLPRLNACLYKCVPIHPQV
ncbi:hypothetical protein Cgig2_020416 [Carnegiea gigantea]|uniref:Cytochrome P450 n=1 Tax=Carnegiea gigantea TaxID=171969 RepID=A0A9Q1QCT2_9CARY|nr:hypothetical protein Cgig2_020416 [Carnegiea gigantea]